MEIKNQNLNRSTSANQPSVLNRTVNRSLSALSPGEIHAQLNAALQRIAQLETQVHRLEGAVHVGTGGDVEIHAQGAIRILASTQVAVEGKLGGALLKDKLGNSITLSASGLSLASTSPINLQAASMKCKTALSTFSGIVKCEKVVATTVTAHSITPGVGNIL